MCVSRTNEWLSLTFFVRIFTRTVRYFHFNHFFSSSSTNTVAIALRPVQNKRNVSGCYGHDVTLDNNHMTGLWLSVTKFMCVCMRMYVSLIICRVIRMLHNVGHIFKMIRRKARSFKGFPNALLVFWCLIHITVPDSEKSQTLRQKRSNQGHFDLKANSIIRRCESRFVPVSSLLNSSSKFQKLVQELL